MIGDEKPLGFKETAVPTRIDYVDETLNFMTGCSKVSPGCLNCYAEKMAMRLHAAKMFKYRRGFDVTLHPGVLADLRKRREKPGRRWLVCSMGDLFHDQVDFDFLDKAFDAMSRKPREIFLALTKRSHRMMVFANAYQERRGVWPENIWLGVTVECADYENRIQDLLRVTMAKKWISLEPLLAPPGLFLEPYLEDLDWVVAGAETGHGARPVDPAWFEQYRDECVEFDVPYWVKQVNAKHDQEVDGELWKQTPFEVSHDTT